MSCGNRTLFEEGSELILTVPCEGSEHLLSQQGVIKNGNQFEKRFPTHRFFYKEKDIDMASALFRGKCDFVFGTSGYSDLNPNRCRELNIPDGHYVSALGSLVKRALDGMKQRVPAIRPGIVYGSSSMGVDFTLEKVAENRNIPIIGTTCLAYLWYVDNTPNGPTILIASSEDDYCKLYVSNLDLLVAVNGGTVSYDMDIYAATKKFIPVVPVDVLSVLGATVPAFVFDEQGRRKVNDAVRVLLYAWRLLDLEHAGLNMAQDRFEIAACQFGDAMIARAREVAPAKYAYT